MKYICRVQAGGINIVPQFAAVSGTILRTALQNCIAEFGPRMTQEGLREVRALALEIPADAIPYEDGLTWTYGRLEFSCTLAIKEMAVEETELACARLHYADGHKDVLFRYPRGTDNPLIWLLTELDDPEILEADLLLLDAIFGKGVVRSLSWD